MHEIIFVGGLPYSGKTTLCNRLAQTDTDRFWNMNYDDTWEEIEKDPRRLCTYLHTLSPQIMTSWEIDLVNDTGTVIAERVSRMKRLAHKQGGLLMWTQFINLATNTYLLTEMLKLDNTQVPIIESLFVDLDMRVSYYAAMSEALELLDESSSYNGPLITSDELDQTKKTFVYLNPGLDACLTRFATGPSPIFGRANEPVIKHLHSQQQIPAKGDFPNLDVVIIQDETEISTFVEAYEV